MIKQIEHYAVNWVDGMKISERHFNAHTNFTLDSLRDSNSLHITNFNYGLLPLTTNREDVGVFDVFNSMTGDVQLVVKRCSAITPAGFRIELNNYATNLKSLAPTNGDTLEAVKQDFYLIVSVNPYDKLPHGDVDLEETPPRHPYTRPNYHIELMPISSFDTNTGSSGGNYIVIGKVAVQGGKIIPDGDFIPPCSSITSHPSLLRYYNDLAQSMAMLQTYATTIIQKNSNLNQNTKLVANIKVLCQALLNHIGSVYFQFRNILPYSAPIYLVDCFSQLAIHILNATKSMAASELEEMLNYINEWSEVPPQTLLTVLGSVTEINYQHIDCGIYLRDIKLLLQNLEKIFLKLSELDYIGQNKENIIVNELDVTPMPKTNKGWSVLD